MEKDGWIIDNFTMISDEIKEKKDKDKDTDKDERSSDRQQHEIQRRDE